MTNDVEVGDRVVVKNTTDKNLDGQYATVVGKYSTMGKIIMFDTAPSDYDPAIVLANACIERVK